MTLRSRIIVQCLGVFVAMSVLLFIPAGTVHFWQAWVFMGITFVPMIIFTAYYYKKDPVFVERRMQKREKIAQQRWIMRAASVLTVLSLVVPGLDYRIGWTRELFGGVPTWVQIAAQVVTLVSYSEALVVMDANRYASRTIQVEEHQPVISNGPYAVVRHPMYAFVSVMWLAVGPALGSYITVPLSVLFIPLLVLRLLNEEAVLRRDLHGYIEYCEGTRYRLVPYIW